MRQFDCPQCSAPVPFETPAGVFAVCPNCRSMVVRKDIGLEAIGTMAELPPDHSPLQIGARGTYKDKRFKLLGRLRVLWQDGAWDEWYADFGNNGYGWVAETQGFFMISEARTLDDNVASAIRELDAGRAVVIAGKEYRVSDIKEATAQCGEGELPFVAVPGESWHSVDLASPGRGFAGVKWHEGKAQFFVGASAMWDEIRWEGLKAVPGWKGEPVPVEKKLTQALNCPNCGGVVEQKLAGLTTTLACSHCGTLIDITQSRTQIGQKVKKVATLVPAQLPLGKRGILRGVEWELLGCLWRKDAYVTWKEMLLYNPWQGFAWLTESDSHWNFVTRYPDVPEQSSSGLSMGGRSYRYFGSGEAEVVQVTGEFYWKVRVGEKAIVTDYIAPPYILSSEQYPELHETTWSAGEYISSEEVGTAFGQKLRKPDSTYLNQPNPWQQKRGEFVKMGLLALAAAIVLQLLCSSFSAHKDLLDQDVTVVQSGAEGVPAVSQAFDMKALRPAQITLKATNIMPFLDLTGSLVNESTGTHYAIPVFPGYATGSTRESVCKLPSVPAGKYHVVLNLDPRKTVASEQVHIHVEQGGLFTSNFVISLLALAIVPGWAIYRHSRFESERWAQSGS